MLMLAGATSRTDFLHVQPDSSSHALHFRMRKPLQTTLPAPFPGLFFEGNHMRHRIAERTFVVKHFQISIIGIFDGARPRVHFLSRPEHRLGLLIAAQHDIDIFLNSEDPFFYPIADELPLLIMKRLCSLWKSWFLSELDLLALG